MVEVRWTDKSLDDIQSIAEFIGKDSEKYAFIQVKKIFEAENILTHYPKSGRVVPELARDNIREIIRGNYRVIYRLINEKRIDVLTVHHSRMLLKRSSLQRTRKMI